MSIGETTLAAEGSVAAQMLRSWHRLGVEAIFINPGTDTAPVQEAAAALGSTGVAIPRLILCPHEATALAAAHAYFAVTGRPQVVMVHVDVGTQNLGAMVHDAARGAAGVVIMAGRAPITGPKEGMPGHRDHHVQWVQDAADQAGIVRPYVKWSADLDHPLAVEARLRRALQVASSAEPGPVYLTASREVLMAPAAAVAVAAEPVLIPGPAGMPAESLDRFVDLVVRARRPVVVSTRLGRRPSAVPELVRLVELLGAHVVDVRHRMNFPSEHRAYRSDPMQAQAVVEQADLVLVLDSLAPTMAFGRPKDPSATVIVIDPDPVRPGLPLWEDEADLLIQADPPAVVTALANRIDATDPASAAGRAPWPFVCSTAVADRAGEAAAASGGPPWPPGEALAAVSRALEPDDIVIEESTTLAADVRAALRRENPGTIFSSGGSGLGWGLGAAFGAAVAAPGRRIVALVGDGAFIFGEPVAAFVAAARAGVGFVVVVLDNGGYAATRRPVTELYPEGVGARTGNIPVTSLAGSVDFGKVAEACGGIARRCDDLSSLTDVLRSALADAAAERRVCVVALGVSSPWM